jgi:hypothetical protein
MQSHLDGYFISIFEANTSKMMMCAVERRLFMGLGRGLHVDWKDEAGRLHFFFLPFHRRQDIQGFRVWVDLCVWFGQDPNIALAYGIMVGCPTCTCLLVYIV